MSDEVPSDAFVPMELADMPVEDALASLFLQATRIQSSDLFFLSDRNSVKICVKRLGRMEELADVSSTQGRHLITHIKVMANMDISEQRRPADGRWLYQNDDTRLDLRINSIATTHGEDLTVRIWNRDQELLGLDDLGLADDDVAMLKNLLSNPAGLILLTGPTGTGKTTSSYACLGYLNDGTRKINTLEDPVEFSMQGVRQSQVMPKIGVDFPELLRGILRQAPDVIMIGEIRDEYTASTAVRAANSGHLVLATLHAPIAAGAVQSMLALGAHPFFLSSCLLGVVAQRLVRTLCPKCRHAFDLGDVDRTFAEIRDLLKPEEGRSLYGPGGCEECYSSGYAGRTGLFEIMMMNSKIRSLIVASSQSAEIHRAAIESGMLEFRRGALLKMARGITSIEEVMQNVPAEYLGLEE